MTDLWNTCIDVAPDRKHFAVGRSDGSVLLVALASGQPIAVLREHEDRVSAVAFEGSRLWSASFDGTVCAWNLGTGQRERRFGAEHGRITSIRIVAGYVATVGDDGHARLWHPENGVLEGLLEEKRFGPSYAITSTGSVIAIGYESGHIGVWQAGHVGSPWQYEGNFAPAGGDKVFALAISHDRKTVACARLKGVAVHAPGEWRQTAHFRVPSPIACNDLAFSPNGLRLAGACSDDRVRLWQREGGKPWNVFATELGGGMIGGKWTPALICAGVRFLDDARLLSAHFDGSVRLWTLDPRATLAIAASYDERGTASLSVGATPELPDAWVHAMGPPSEQRPMEARAQRLASALLRAANTPDEQDGTDVSPSPTSAVVPTPPLHARSSPECHLYMALHGCDCGDATMPAHRGVQESPLGLVASYASPCPRCRRARDFDFVLDPEIPPDDAFGGAQPSRLICPGQFALHSDRLASRWPADSAAVSGADRPRAREDLAWAVRALEEVIKFIPGGGTDVPQEAFRSAEGRALYAAEAGRFRGPRLNARLTAYRDLLARFARPQ